ncbi:hypothetical protein C1X64_29085 [Pseudomonas sp. GW456-E7]|nr:hypothetical protein C1X64_29085 [Pseudomonas sp. GW456-E7]
MDSRALRSASHPAYSLTTIASKLAPTQNAGACLKTSGVTSRKLQRLASLPTGTPESAGLCVWNAGLIVCRSLKNSDRVW